MSTRRNLTLAFAVLSSLSAGTNYLYSLYSPQLAARLGLTSTQANIVGLSANLGVYLSGPFVGYVIDTRGIRPVLLFGAALLATGYSLIRFVYDGGADGAFKHTGISLLVVGEVLTGIGSSSALFGASNGAAKSFPPARRGAVLSVVYSAFGISAAFFSSISHLTFLHGSDPTSSFLLLLAIFTGVAILSSSIFVRPPPVTTAYKVLRGDVEDEPEDTSAPERAEQEEGEKVPSGVALFRDSGFLFLWAIMLLTSGTGLMFINNIGSVAQTLAPTTASSTDVAALQAHLVTILSVFNCGGRLLSGFSSDYIVHHAPQRWRFSRGWFLSAMSTLFLISQLVMIQTTTAEGLVYATALTGLAYGTLFGLMPVLVLEYFGISNFSGNNGLLSLAPAVGGNLCNLAFGWIYDSYVPTPKVLLAVGALVRRGGRAPDRLCLLGQSCYVEAFYLTSSMCLMALVLSIVASLRHDRRIRGTER